MSRRGNFNLFANGLFAAVAIIILPIAIIVLSFRFAIWAIDTYKTYKSKNHFTLLSYKSSSGSNIITRVFRTCDYALIKKTNDFNFIHFKQGFRWKIKKFMIENQLNETLFSKITPYTAETKFCLIHYRSLGEDYSSCIRIIETEESEIFDYSQLEFSYKQEGNLFQLRDYITNVLNYYPSQTITNETRYFT